MLQRKDVVPHFVVTTLTGATVRYADIWQQRFLVLLSLPETSDGRGGSVEDESARAYVARVERLCASAEVPTTCVGTTDAVPGVPRPGALVADRFGEIAFIDGADSVDALPSAESLMEWLGYIAIRCS